MLTLKMVFTTPDGNKLNVSVPVQLDEESMKRLEDHMVTVLNGISSASIINN